MVQHIVFSTNEIELDVFAKGSFFNEGQYDDNKIRIKGNFYEYADTYSNNVIALQLNGTILLPPTHHDNPKFRIVTQILPFFTEGKMKSQDYCNDVLSYYLYFRDWLDYNWIDITIYNVSIAKTYNSSYLLHQTMYIWPNVHSLAYAMFHYEGLVLYF